MEDSVVLEDTREKSVSSDLIRGHINTIILRALYDGDKYGYEIIAEIEQKSHGQYSLKQPSLYSALKRLEKDGYVTSYWGGSVSGGRRKYFSLTEAGKTISEQNQAEWEYSRTVIDSLISDKDFDFSNPAPTAVNMRVLKETTSRVPRGEGGDDELDYEPSFDDTEELGKLEARYREQLQELDEKRSELDSRKQAFEEEMRSRNEAIMRERDWRESEIAAREQSLAQKRAELEQLRAEQKAQAEQQAELAAQQAEQTARAESEQAEELRNRISSLEYELKESEAALEAARQQNELQAEEDRIRAEALFDDERHAYNEQIRSLETERDEERARYDEQLKAIEADRENERRSYDERMKEAEDNLANERSTFNDQLNQALAEERARHAEELRQQEQRIVAEQEELFRKREQQLLHRNYLDLVNTPPAEEPPHDYNYYTAAPADAQQEEEQTPLVEDYRSVVHRLYSNAVSGESAPAPAPENNARSLDGIDFTDLEARAAQDGIRIQTAGSKAQKEQESVSLVHKGKALFLSGLVTFLFCVALGSILLGLSASLPIPAFYPYLIWSVGLAVLLVTGLAYANRYGERALRRTGPVILNVVVSYILLVIVTLIVALSAKIDFTNQADLTAWVTIPVIAFLGVILFGVVYYLQVRPKKD